MTEAQSIAGEKMWDAVGADARQDWAVWEAAHDVKVLGTLKIIGQQRRIKSETAALARDGLRIQILRQYEDVPLTRCEDVFLAAQSIILEERISNGEA